MNTLTEEKKQELCSIALKMRKRAYVPYSGHSVGAALLAEDGRIFTGCNVENAAYGPTICAERTAFVKAVSEGCRSFVAIAVAGGMEETPEKYCPPCGTCRQVMAEFCGEDFIIMLARTAEDHRDHTLGELLPLGFHIEEAAQGKGEDHGNS